MASVSIATEDQQRFFFRKLDSVLGSPDINTEGKTSKNSFRVWRDKIQEAFDSSSVKLYPPPTGDTLNTLYIEKRISRGMSVVQALALTILYHEKKMPDLTVNSADNLLQNKTAWDYFVEAYQIEMEFIEENFVYYFWHISKISMVRLTLNSKKTESNWQNVKHVRFYQWDDPTGSYLMTLDHPEGEILKSSNSLLESLSSIIRIKYGTAEFNLCLATRQEILNRKLYVGVYSGVNSGGDVAAGIGILERQNNSRDGTAFPPTHPEPSEYLRHFLFQTRQFVENESVKADRLDKLPDSGEVQLTNALAGNWRIFYLRNDKPEGLDQNKGGLEINLLFIDYNGDVALYSDGENKQVYNGLISFPMSGFNNKVVSIYLHQFNGKRAYKLHLFLNLRDGNQVMEGVFSGINEKGKVFSALVWFQKISNDFSVKELKANTGFVHKQKIQENALITPEVIHFLNNYTNPEKLLNLPVDCLPYGYLYGGEANNASEYSGRYFLISYDHELGKIVKAKLTISIDGAFSVSYPDAAYRGVSRKIMLGAQEFLSFEIHAKIIQDNKEETYLGTYIFHFDPQHWPHGQKGEHVVSRLPGLSLRRNREGFIQVKKEIMVKSLYTGKFDSEPAAKYYYKDDSLFDNIDFNAPNPEQFKFISVALRNDLMGKENNLIQLPRKHVNRQDTKLRKNNYHKIYLKSFLFDVMTDSKTDHSTYVNFIEAVLHGVLDGKYIAELIQTVLPKRASKKDIDELLNLLICAEEEVSTVIREDRINALMKAAHHGTPDKFIKSKLFDLINEFTAMLRKLSI